MLVLPAAALLLAAPLATHALPQAPKPAPATPRQLDQVSPSMNAWFYTEPGDVWQQVVRVGMDGVLDSFEVTVEGPAAAEVELRLRVGDGWNVGPVVWSALYAKTSPDQERPVFDVRAAGIALQAGETFVLEAEGNGSGAELVGRYMHPQVGPPGYPEELFLNGPGQYLDGGWRIGFRTWMRSAWTGPGRLDRVPARYLLLPGPAGWLVPLLFRLPSIDMTDAADVAPFPGTSAHSEGTRPSARGRGPGASRRAS